MDKMSQRQAQQIREYNAHSEPVGRREYSNPQQSEVTLTRECNKDKGRTELDFSYNIYARKHQSRL